MLKPISNLLSRTPWWGLIGFGLGIIVLLVLLAIPINVLRLEARDTTAAEGRAIQREMDAAFGLNGLALAESVVTIIQRLGSDPVRRVELDRALDEINRARNDLSNGTGLRHEAPVSPVPPASPALPAKPLDEAAMAQREQELEAAHDAAISKYEAAVEVREALERSRDDLQRILKQNEVPVKDWPKSLDPSVEAALSTEHAAKAAVDRARAKLNQEMQSQSEEQARERAESLGTYELPEPLRLEIREAVASDFFRMVAGLVVVLLFIPLFMVAVIAKFFIGRARSLQKLAEEKGTEAEHHNIRRQLTEARLQALQAQVEPHFLYNTLANVQALIETDPAAANTMVGHLIDYLRAALPKMRENISTVAQEVELASAYLNILKMRMGERLEFSIDIGDQSGTRAMPPLMLPSLVENAIKHGLEPVREGGRIDIRAYIDGNRLIVTVTDNGRGMRLVNAGSDGVGLSNIRERLSALYGEAASLELQDNTPRGVVARISVPLALPQMVAATEKIDMAASNAEAHHPVGGSAATAKSAPARFFARLGSFLQSAHGVWQRFLIATYSVLMIGIGIAFLGAWVGQMFDLLPLEIVTDAVNLQFTGVGGTVLSGLTLLAVYGLLSLVLLLVFLLLYGMGFVVTGMILLAPVMLAISVLTPLVPLLIVGLLIYLLVRRKNP
ncbi:MAG: histidine kinase [Rhodocyclaceae bacterium]|nr:histidine kinase [Rhodocyclaceae bacterium]